MTLDVGLAAELTENVLCEHFTELNAHLVVRVDSPNSPLDVNLVLVHGHQGSERSWRQFLEHDRVCGLVSLEDLGFDERGVGSLGTELLGHLLLRLAKGECFGLSEEVGQEDLVVLSAGDGVESLNGCEEITKQYVSCRLGVVQMERNYRLTMGSAWCPGG